MIKRKRQSLGITQAELANLLGVSPTTVSMWEVGKSHPRVTLLPRVAELLGCTVDELLGREEAAHDQRHG